MTRRVLPLLALAAAALAASGCAPGTAKCDAPLTACSTLVCSNLQVDPQHCGQCDTSCSAGQSCLAGKCECPGGTALCGGICVATATDASNCGACGNTCKAGLACISGHCLCPPDTTACGEACVDTRTNPKHCGTCEKACDQSCQASVCVADCTGGATDCSGSCVDLSTDHASCGTCGKPCVGEEVCTGGVCGCAGGKALCGLQCVDLAADPVHCGACATVCKQGQSCLAGVCTGTVFATCYSGGDLVAMDDNLTQQPTRAEHIGAGPQSIALLPGPQPRVLVADSMDNAVYTFDATQTPAKRVPGGDTAATILNQLLVRGTEGYVISSGDNLVQRLDLSRAVPDPLDSSRTVKADLPLGANTNPYLAALLGEHLYVTLYGNCFAPADTSGNRLAELDLAQGVKGRELAFDPAKFKRHAGVTANAPRPAGLAAVGTRLFVAIGNLTPDCMGPAGPGYLAVVETSGASLVMGPSPIELPAECTNPGFVVATADRVFVSCSGSWGWGTTGEALVIVDAATEKVVKTVTFPRCANPAEVGPDACKTVVPGRLALRGDRVLIADNNAGRLLVTDLDGAPVKGFETGLTLCPLKCPGGDETKQCSQMVSDVYSAR